MTMEQRHNLIEGITPMVSRLAEEMRRLPQIEIPIEHHFCEGVYVRKMTMPKGSCVVGKIHTHSQINTCCKGEVRVVMGDEVVVMKAGDVVVCPEGARRAFYAHEESIWTVTLRTDETDIEKIESEFVVETEQQYLEFQKRILCLS